MTEELNAARLLVAIGAIAVVAGVLIPTERVYVVLLGLAFILNGILLHAFLLARNRRWGGK